MQSANALLALHRTILGMMGRITVLETYLLMRIADDRSTWRSSRKPKDVRWPAPWKTV